MTELEKVAIQICRRWRRQPEPEKKVQLVSTEEMMKIWSTWPDSYKTVWLETAQLAIDAMKLEG